MYELNVYFNRTSQTENTYFDAVRILTQNPSWVINLSIEGLGPTEGIEGYTCYHFKGDRADIKALYDLIRKVEGAEFELLIEGTMVPLDI